jgi:hypothetical protein
MHLRSDRKRARLLRKPADAAVHRKGHASPAVTDGERGECSLAGRGAQWRSKDSTTAKHRLKAAYSSHSVGQFAIWHIPTWFDRPSGFWASFAAAPTSLAPAAVWMTCAQGPEGMRQSGSSQ